MADNSTLFKIKAVVEGAENLTRLKKSIKQLQNTAKPTARDLVKLRVAAREVGNSAKRTENDIRTQIAVLTDLRANVALTGTSYKKLTQEINQAEAALAKSGASGKGAKNRFAGAAKTAGAIAAGGVFGGPEGMAGAGIGAVLGGGPGGAAVGAAIGAQVSMVRKSIGETTSYSAALSRQRKALRLVIGDTVKYDKAQAFLRKTSKELAIPQDVIVRQFTALTASVKGAGHSVADAEKVFESIAAGIRGTGGSLEDMKSAMRATSQVFSKGKVSAEELRQQLGERLPGAFTLFAQSMDRTPAELDKALEQGKVTLDDFMKFSGHLFATYGENAKILAAGPEAAGDRLATAMSSLKDNVGALLAPVGAQFQDTFTTIVKYIDGAAKSLKDFLKLGEENMKDKLKDLVVQLKEAQDATAGIRARMETAPMFATLGGAMTKGQWNNVLKANLATVKELEESIVRLESKIKLLMGTGEGEGKGAGDKKKGAFVDLKAGAKAYLDSVTSFSKQVQDTVVNAFKGMEDALVEFVKTGKLSFRSLAQSIVSDMARIAIQQMIMKPFTGWFENLLPNADGNVFAQNGIQKFARGGIVDKPTIFPFKNGVGLMGEESAEAIMPLKRGRDGKLGVTASGGGGTVINVAVDASGTSVEGDQEKGRQFGDLLAAAINSELLKAKRPGGLLAPA